MGVSTKFNSDCRIQCVGLIYVQNGNPNGDPDDEGRPRADTFPDGNEYGLISGVSIKRCLRKSFEKKGMGILMRRGSDLAITKAEVAEEIGEKPIEKGKKNKIVRSIAIRDRIRDKFIDSRLFGCVLSGKQATVNGKTYSVDAPEITGCVTINNQYSYYPIEIIDRTITRCCVSGEENKIQTMGGTSGVRFGIYPIIASYDPEIANHQGGLKDGDIELLLNLLPKITEENQSCMKGEWGVIQMIAIQYPKGASSFANHHLLKKIVKPSLKEGIEIPTSLDDVILPTIDHITACAKKIDNGAEVIVLREEILDVV